VLDPIAAKSVPRPIKFSAPRHGRPSFIASTNSMSSRKRLSCAQSKERPRQIGVAPLSVARYLG